MKKYKIISLITAALFLFNTGAYASNAKFVNRWGLFSWIGIKQSTPKTVETIVTQNAEEFTAQDGTLAVIENTPTNGSLNSTVPEMGIVAFAIETPPIKGTVVINDAMTGDFTYTPFENETGEDYFEFSVSNETYGQKTATISVTISPSDEEEEPELSPSPSPTVTPTPTPPAFTFKYEDMLGHWGEYSAAKLAEDNILKGFQIADKYFFYPETELTRGDFILYLVSAMGLDVEPYAEVASPFADAMQTPAWMNLQAKAAYDAGIIKGSLENGELYLHASERLTRIEALAMLNNAIKPDAVSVDTPEYTDMYLVPQWGVVYIKNMTAYGLVQGYDDGTIRPFAKITRAQAAEMIVQTLKYIDEHPEVEQQLEEEMDESMNY